MKVDLSRWETFGGDSLHLRRDDGVHVVFIARMQCWMVFTHLDDPPFTAYSAGTLAEAIEWIEGR